MNKQTLEQAADWFDQQDSLEGAQATEFKHWLATPENADAYRKISQLMQSAEVNAALNNNLTSTISTETHEKDPSQNKGKSKVFSFYQFNPINIAASLLCIAFITSFFIFQQNTTNDSSSLAAVPKPIYQQQFQAPVGSRSSQVLQDGTQVHLNADSQLEVQQTSTSRYAQMTHGQIYFDVAKDKTRPFVIDVGEVQIRVLGTAFDVDHTNARTLISVYEGRVQINADDVFTLVKGEQLIVENGRGSKVTFKQLAMLPAWRSGWLEVEQQPLQDVVAHMQRYIEKPVEIVTQDLLNRKISGRFPLDKAEQSLALIASAHQFTVTYEANKILLSK
ncbi:FecR domain-containing protein [Aliiglaciecola sp. 3_MG-2023]|uniref:FecR family protein n=1 Tax=Aliiglaciecola sp. 3_MG-2023 TaxID=3062644 RepID=UPI0026E33ACF|nr:FecR domain-containing protein [Aliiglaciecola sp. 3_MG-2023]MDO6694311.1 FecR domain-containing protein [Aliiglaciecola sp. 3_MG-2023]